MFDIKLLRSEPDLVRAAMEKRNAKVDLDGGLEIDAKRRTLVYEMEQLRAEQNAASQEIGLKKRAKEDASEAIAAMKTIKEKIGALEEQVREVDAQLQSFFVDLAQYAGRRCAAG